MKQTWTLEAKDVEYIIREHVRRLNNVEPEVKMLSDNPNTRFFAEVTIERDYIGTRETNVRG